jgi:hypothetical protein
MPRFAIPARGKLYISHIAPFPFLRSSSSLRFHLRSPPTSCSECVACCRSRSCEEGSLCSWSSMMFSSRTISLHTPLPSFLPITFNVGFRVPPYPFDCHLKSPPTSCKECVVCCRSRLCEVEGSFSSRRIVWSSIPR